MQIELSTHQVEPTEEVRRQVEAKAQHLLRIFDGIRTFRVTLRSEKKGIVAEFVADISHGAPLVAKGSGTAPHLAIDLAAQKVEVQLRRHKEKAREHRRRDQAAGPSPSASGQEASDTWQKSSTTE